MSNIDKQRITAVRTLEAMGYLFRDEWIAPAGVTAPATAEADAMHVLLVLRADAIEGCAENPEEARELAMIAEVVEALRGEAMARWQGTRRQRLALAADASSVAVLGKPRPVIGTRPSSVGSSPDPGRLGSRAAQRVASP